MPNPHDPGQSARGPFFEVLTADQQAIVEECDRLKAMLVQKNAAYGSSALDPIRVFSKADPVEQIRVRLDDKLTRVQRADSNALGEDAIFDAAGYLVLLLIAERRAREEKRVGPFSAVDPHPLGPDPLEQLRRAATGDKEPT